MDDLNKSQESMGAAAAGVKRQVSETAADAKEKLTELGGDRCWPAFRSGSNC
jgi:hypothetical protein